jgi:uncharacterized protein (DUF1800 family)
MDVRAAHALIRFGLGRRGSEAAPPDPLAWLAGQLDGPDPALATPGATCAEALAARREDHKNPLPDGQKPRARVLWEADFAATVRGLLEAEQPFRERLVWFWANHFTISLRRGELHPLAIPYLREAIRPHVTGRFADMLSAVMHHPAMLSYLDNTDSFGPDSFTGLKLHRGLNENLARECLELHTVTPAAGYTQQDVTEFARVLTGWSMEPAGPTPGFFFFPGRHEPGPKVVLGQTYPQGQEGGEAALAWLGHHPASFRHIATRLVCHFVADTPVPRDVARIDTVMRQTGGDLKAAYLGLLRLPSAWQPLTKLRAPADYIVAVVRALDLAEGNRPDVLGLMSGLGQPFMAPPLPNGWPDTATVWAEGELLLRRADWSMSVSGRVPAADPVEIAQSALGPLLSAETLSAIRHAPSRREGLALLLASPEFQRR